MLVNVLVNVNVHEMNEPKLAYKNTTPVIPIFLRRAMVPQNLNASSMRDLALCLIKLPILGKAVFNGEDPTTSTTSINLAIFMDSILLLGGIGCQNSAFLDTVSRQIKNRSRARARKAKADHLLRCNNASVNQNRLMTTTIED